MKWPARLPYSWSFIPWRLIWIQSCLSSAKREGERVQDSNFSKEWSRICIHHSHSPFTDEKFIHALTHQLLRKQFKIALQDSHMAKERRDCSETTNTCTPRSYESYQSFLNFSFPKLPIAEASCSFFSLRGSARQYLHHILTEYKKDHSS